MLKETLKGLGEDDGVLEWWRVLLQLGRMHRDLKAWEAARLYYEMALEMARAAEYPRGVSMCERGIGLCYEGEGHLKSAREHIVWAVEISTPLDDPYLPTLLKELHRIEGALAAARNDQLSQIKPCGQPITLSLLPPEFPAILDRYLAQYHPRECLFECTGRNLEYIPRDVVGQAGIPGGISFDTLRWTSAVRDYRAGMPLETPRQKLGLSPVTWQYTAEKIKRLTSPTF